MLELFLTFINQQKLGLESGRTLLTVSGGIDSVVLTHLFHKAGFSAGIAHCNFGLRGEESDEDEVFVRQLAQEYGFPFFVKHFDTSRYANEKGISTQMAARELRYQWFEEIRAANHFDRIATAHHLNDSLETVLLNLVRGTGLAGVAGIDVKNESIIRPLLFATRSEIVRYVEANNLFWREDSSNESDYYKRNLIRHKVIPVLQQLNPSLEKTFKTTTQRLAASEVLLNTFLEDWKNSATKVSADQLEITYDVLEGISEPVYRLWFLLKDFGFTYTQAEEIYKTKDGLAGKAFFSASHRLLRDRRKFLVSANGADTDQESVILENPETLFTTDRFELKLEVISRTPEFEVKSASETGYFDLATLIFPLTVRGWQIGDTFCPFGMKGKKKKVSDLLIDKKLSIAQKREVKVLVNANGEILWVVGIRTDERFKVGAGTKMIMVAQARQI